MKFGRVVPAAAGVYLFFLLVTAPAAKILPLLQPQWPGMSLVGVSGSLWSGKAMQVNTQMLGLTEVAWDVRLLAVLKGALEMDVDGRLNGQPVALRAGRGVFSGTYLRDVRGRVAADDLLRWLKLNRVGVDGQLDFALESVDWDVTVIPVVSGTVDWAPALLSKPIELNFGSVHLDTVEDGGATVGKLTASGGALAVQGDVSLQPDGQYQLLATLSKQGTVPAAVENFLNTFTEFKDGSYRLEWSDQLKF